MPRRTAQAAMVDTALYGVELGGDLVGDVKTTSDIAVEGGVR